MSLRRSLLLLATAGAAGAQTVTTPKQHFGFNIGDDYQLATYTQFIDYWQKLDKESDRMKVVEIGKTAEGPAAADGDHHLAREPQEARSLQGDLARLAHGRRADRRAGARAGAGRQGRRLDRRRAARDRSARRAAADRDGLSAGQPHRSRDDCASSTIWSSSPCTPTRTAWSWCRAGTCASRSRTRRSTGGLPRLYQKYIGHDNNRDFYMSNAAREHEHEPRACTSSGSRRSCTTITRPARPAR